MIARLEMATLEEVPVRARFTADVLNNIRVWVDQGMSVDEIAERVGTSVNSLRTTCSRHKISLSKNVSILTVNMPKDLKETFVKRAKSSGQTTHELVKNLLEVIARDNLFDAVLDEDDS